MVVQKSGNSPIWPTETQEQEPGGSLHDSTNISIELRSVLLFGVCYSVLAAVGALDCSGSRGIKLIIMAFQLMDYDSQTCFHDGFIVS